MRATINDCAVGLDTQVASRVFYSIFPRLRMPKASIVGWEKNEELAVDALVCLSSSGTFNCPFLR
jgi:hypothetical protein